MERKRFKELLKQRGISGRDFAKSVGLEYGSYRSALSRGNCPKWVLAFLFGWDSHGDEVIEVLRNGQRIAVWTGEDSLLDRSFNFEDKGLSFPHQENHAWKKYSTPLEYKEFPRRKNPDASQGLESD